MIVKMDTPRHHNETSEFGIFTGPDIYNHLVPKEPIIEGLFNSRDHLIISSRAGIGKSILALQLVCNLTTGASFLDTFNITRPYRVLYVQTEGDRAETIGRLKHMLKVLKIDNCMWAHYNAVGIALNTSEGLRKFLEDVESLDMDFDIIIIDPLYPTVKGSLNADDVATDWQRSTRIIRSKFPNVSYIIFHHEPSKDNWQDGARISKPTDDLFGSTMWGAWMSANYKMELRSDGVRVLRSGKGEGKGRTGQGITEIHMRLIEPTPLYYVIDDTNLNETETVIWGIFNNSPEKRFRRVELEKSIEKSKPTVCRVLSTLIKSDRIIKIVEEGLVYYTKAPKKD